MWSIKPNADYLFEVSWEVCNKVGGIYTVVKSKAKPQKDLYGDNYFLIGPYFVSKAAGEFQEQVPQGHLKEAFERLKPQGIECHYGTWSVPSEPKVILIEFSAFAAQRNDIKRALWDQSRIDSLSTDYHDFDEPVIWSWSAGKVIEEIARGIPEKRIVAHFHEWLAGAGVLYLSEANKRIGTVFTTHATVMGRTLSSVNVNIYEQLDKLDFDGDAKKSGAGTLAKHQLEKAAAHTANVFVTVSEITGIEAKSVLKKAPDLITPNGLDVDKFPTLEEAIDKHRLYRKKMREFILYYFMPYYHINIEKTRIFFIAGRYEFRVKGIDVLIKSLGQLNARLKQEDTEEQIVMFIFVPGNIKSIKQSLLENKTLYQDIKDSVEDEMGEIRSRIIHGIVGETKISEESLFLHDDLSELKRKVRKLKKHGGLPPLCSHDLYNENEDAILGSLMAHGLSNKQEDKVKVIFYPIYLTGADGLLDTAYYESMLGSHLGIFPSYYEPWGYTPLESSALGIPSITTDLAGFGKFILNESDYKKLGIYVLKRQNMSDDQITKELADLMHRFSCMSRNERMRNKIEARHLASQADWRIFIARYIEAHNLALRKASE